MVSEADVYGIDIRTIYVEPKYYEDRNGNQYTCYVWEEAEIAIVADCLDVGPNLEVE